MFRKHLREMAQERKWIDFNKWDNIPFVKTTTINFTSILQKGTFWTQFSREWEFQNGFM